MREIDHLNLQVPDLEAALKYYTEVMGFEIKHRFSGPKSDFVFATDGTITYEIVEKPNIEVGVFDHIAYVSKDINADFEHFSKLGLVTSAKIGFVDFLFDAGMYYFFIKGSAGERIEICQKK